MYMADRTGVGIITCNRPDFLNNLLKSLEGCRYDELVVVNDGDSLPDLDIPTSHTLLQNETNLGVGKSKNRAMQYLLDNDCDHLFLLEDDVFIKDKNVFKKYIDVSEAINVKHLNYCLHGQDNKINNKPNPRIILDIKGIRVALYFNIYGALSYYHRDVIEDVGFMDEEYYNAMEHVDHTMRCIQKGYHPPFRWFVDIENSNQLLEDQDYNHNRSKIRTGDWMKSFREGVDLFKRKFDVDVTNPYQQYSTKEDVIKYFKGINV